MNVPRKQRETGLYGPVWTELNKVIDVLRSLVPKGGRGIRITSGVNGSTYSVEAERAKAFQVQQYILVSIQNDFYTCYEWDGTTAGTTEIYIARPFEHRVSNFNGRTIDYSSDGDVFSATYSYTSATKRTKTISGTAETQVLIPLFKAAFHIIYAIETDSTFTVGPSNTPLTDPNDEPITLLDLNLDGRAWCKV